MNKTLYQNKMSHNRRIANKKERGFAIYLMLGFILLTTFSLTSSGHLIIRHGQQQFNALIQAQNFLQAHQSLQIGLVRLKEQAAYLALDEANYVLNNGATDAQMAADRAACLRGRSAFATTNADSFRASLPRQKDGIRSRYFIRDISGTSLPRQFAIYGCALRDGIARVTHGIWQFDLATQSFILQRIEGF